MSAQINYNPYSITDSLLSFVISELNFKDPYDSTGYYTYKRKEWLKKKGVYVIRCKYTKQILYVGRSNYCLYQVAYRHFTQWRKGNCIRGMYTDTWFSRDEVQIALFNYSNDAEYLELLLTNYFKPKYNRNMFTEARYNGNGILRNKQEEMHTADYDLIEWFDSQNEAA